MSSPRDELDAIRRVLEENPDGLPLRVIGDRIGMSVAHRTLLRRLSGPDFERIGQGRAARYRLTSALRSVVGSSTPFELGSGAVRLLRYVRQPLARRTPVAYETEFLDRYRPNITPYLSDDDLRDLERYGRAVPEGTAAGTYAQRILERLLIDLSWNSSRLEGNTYSLLDTRRLIERGEFPDGHSHAEAQMILNHKQAIEFLVQSASEIAMDLPTIRALHALLSEGLLENPVAGGRVREIEVGILGSVYQPLNVPQRITEELNRLLATARQIDHPLEQAFFVMAHLPYLQPFEDVNKRVSRLAANIPLIRTNLSPISFVGVPSTLYREAVLSVYETRDVALLREVFLWAYRRSAGQYLAIRQELGTPDPFRLRWRMQLKDAVAHVVRERMDTREAAAYLEDWSEREVPSSDRAGFIELAESELLLMHDGNFARYRLRPSEFEAWQRIWNDAS